MDRLNRRAFAGLFNLLVCAALLIFVPAWTLDYWQAWLLLLVFFGSSFCITLYLMKNDRGLLERRTKAGITEEKEAGQKAIQFFAALAFAAMFVVPAFDRRFRWSNAPPWADLFGDMLVAIGFYIVFLVFKENTFTSAVIEVATEQRLISTGPYAVVRHPMYAGSLVLMLGVPLALGSWWGVLTIVPMLLVITLRLLDEERFLKRSLPGYSEYQSRVKHRLVPLVF